LVGTRSDLVIPIGGTSPIVPHGTPPLDQWQLPSPQIISNDTIRDYCRQYDITYITCSARTKENINRVFATCVRLQWNYLARLSSSRSNKVKSKCHIQ
jgi:hypothetical protein